MKAIICDLCMDIRGLHPKGEWTTCFCGNVSARWVDPRRGTVTVRAKSRSKVHMLGINNRFLLAGVHGFSSEDIVQAGGTGAAWRNLHEEAIQAPGYLFDKSQRGCWACIFQVGDTGDVTWEAEPPVGGAST